MIELRLNYDWAQSLYTCDLYRLKKNIISMLCFSIPTGGGKPQKFPSLHLNAEECGFKGAPKIILETLLLEVIL